MISSGSLKSSRADELGTACRRQSTRRNSIQPFLTEALPFSLSFETLNDCAQSQLGSCFLLLRVYRHQGRAWQSSASQMKVVVALRDPNFHDLAYGYLKPARLPIPPPGHRVRIHPILPILTRSGWDLTLSSQSNNKAAVDYANSIFIPNLSGAWRQSSLPLQA